MNNSMQSVISERFISLASLPESQMGLAEGALILSAEVNPDLDIESNLGLLSDIVERTRPLFDAADSTRGGVSTLNHALFELEGFRGNKNGYDDPRNSFLDKVLSRRRGLPISLSIIYLEVARRLGLEAYGIGFPGHFLAKVAGVSDSPHGELIVDPFFARILRREDCAARLIAAIGENLRSDENWLRPATAIEIYSRMLNNLKILYLRDGDGLSALGCFDRIIALAPDAELEYRDRGFLLERLNCLRAAIEDYSQFLEIAPGHYDAPGIRRRRDALSLRKPVLN